MKVQKTSYGHGSRGASFTCAAIKHKNRPSVGITETLLSKDNVLQGIESLQKKVQAYELPS